MTDTLTKPERSARMALVRAKDTGPERWVHAVLKGLRFKPNTHGAGLPGTRAPLILCSRVARPCFSCTDAFGIDTKAVSLHGFRNPAWSFGFQNWRPIESVTKERVVR